jgi:uncharacterized SAM-binding protein YcdF (DUF218 family)
VPKACIILEEQATSTFESALYCRRLFQQHGWRRALLVTDRYHLRRGLLSFRSFGMQVQGSGVLSRPRPWRKAARERGREMLALLWYLLRILVWKLRRYGNTLEMRS